MIATIFLLAAQIMQPTNVPIQNPSFERLPNAVIEIDPCFDSMDAVPPGWVRTFTDPIWGGTRIIKPLISNSCLIPVAPDGSWVLFVASSTVSQDLGITPASLQGNGDGDYLLTFWVANRDTVYPGYYEVAIIYGTIDPVTHTVNGHELCSVDGWAKWHFKQISMPCGAPHYLLGNWPDGSGKADPNAHLIISLSHVKGWPLLFDNVRLNFTPQS